MNRTCFRYISHPNIQGLTQRRHKDNKAYAHAGYISARTADTITVSQHLCGSHSHACVYMCGIVCYGMVTRRQRHIVSSQVSGGTAGSEERAALHHRTLRGAMPTVTCQDSACRCPLAAHLLGHAASEGGLWLGSTGGGCTGGCSAVEKPCDM